MLSFSNCLGVPSFARSRPFKEEVSGGLELEGEEDEGLLDDALLFDELG